MKNVLFFLILVICRMTKKAFLDLNCKKNVGKTLKLYHMCHVCHLNFKKQLCSFCA